MMAATSGVSQALLRSVVIGPELGEEVVEKNVDNDPGEAAAGRIEKPFRFQKNRVLVGEAVDGPMQNNAIDKFARVGLEQALRGPANKVAQKGSDA